MQGVNTTDTLFVLLSAAFVMLMSPGLALFYGGMVRKKNILSVLMQCFAALCLLSVAWVLFGYSLAFAPGSGFWGGLQWFGLNGVGFEPFPDYSTGVPNNVFMIYQCMFAVITPALIAGAFAERIRFSGYLIFTLLWATFVYNPLCHWVWGSGGWLRNMGAIDFAGGIVVHTSAGIAALVMTLLIGRRSNLEHNPSPHNLPLVAVGTGLLWFGWFGFNAGSALSVGPVAVNAFIVTNSAAAASGISWCLLEWVRNGKPTLFGLLTGCIAGLATITPCAGYVTPAAGLMIGFFASIVCFIGVALFKPKYNYDDSLDAFGVHGLGGIFGSLAVGFYATKQINPMGPNGLFYGNPRQVPVQMIAIAVSVLFVAVMTFLIYRLVDFFVGMRVKEDEEMLGLDLTQHRERAYTILE